MWARQETGGVRSGGKALAFVGRKIGLMVMMMWILGTCGCVSIRLLPSGALLPLSLSLSLCVCLSLSLFICVSLSVSLSRVEKAASCGEANRGRDGEGSGRVEEEKSGE